MSVYQRKGSKVYHFDFWYKGLRFHGSTEQTVRRRAEAVEAEQRERAKREHKPRVTQSMTFTQAVGKYWDEVGRHKISASEIERNLERLVPLVGANTLLTEIDDERVSKLVSDRRGAKRWDRGGEGTRFVSPATVNRQITQLLRPIMLRARKVWKVSLPDMPDWGSHVLKEPKERVRELRQDEEIKLRAVERDDYLPVRLFAQITGLRLREVVGLTWEQIDFGARTISVVGKGDKPHVVPLTAEIEALLKALEGHHPEQVFTYVAKRSYRNPTAKREIVKGQRYPVTYWGLTTRRKRDFAKAGVKDFRWHDLRHTALSRIVRETGNLKIAKELAGHSDIRTTSRYAHAHQDDVRNAMERVSNKTKSPTESPEKLEDKSEK